LLKVVIVDDEPAILELMQRLLERSGQVQVIGAYSLPSQALNHIYELNPDAVFLDIEMPGMNGIELAARLIERDEDLQVVFVTGYNTYALEAFKVNALDYIMKPVTAGELSKTLLRLSKFKIVSSKTRNKDGINIRCFGRFEVSNSFGLPIKWVSKKAAELLAYFIIHRNTQINKWEICDALWPDSNEQQVTSNFHTTLFRLRKTLQEEGIPMKIDSEKGGRGGYFCGVEDLNCDLIKFEEFIMKGQVVDNNSILEFEHMLSIFEGELFEGNDYGWCIAENKKFLEYNTGIARNMSKYYINKESYKKAFQTLKRTLKLSPLDEEIHQLVMQVFFYQKDRSSIIRHYEKYKALIKQELDLEPEMGTLRVYEKLLEKI
jgi:two-component system LytT family response regulator